MSLRTGAIEALARGVDEAATDFYNLPEGGVEAALDALLDYLEALLPTKREWTAEDEVHSRLIAALRGSP